MSKDVLKTLNRVAEGIELQLRAMNNKEEEIEKKKFHEIICEVTPSHYQNGLWTLEFINKTQFAIRVIKVSAESFFGALIRPNYSVPEHPFRGYIEPKANPSDEIILRNIEPNSSLAVLRELPHYPRNKEVWMNAQISMDSKTDETFPMKLIKVTINV
ncbi:hypothetical protein [Methylomonas methanica]|uniref:Uncharacterized protein n=1 Tax=Methylomonas methanica (strain DSM 25384 / MC09) TaxID=857087 RepID=G0A2A3_METMM|nr:hypothetical protein [Methylomonas methanica]AEF98915.1 hypothetical protein Metme_0471 [Methylomonas methanica MC09]